jgi:hypothetical protein
VAPGPDAAAPAGGAPDALGPSPEAGGGGVPVGGGALVWPDPAGWTLKWQASGSTTGLMGFEGQETAECTHPGVAHAMVAGPDIRMEMHYPADTDCHRGDRQRNEFKGMQLPDNSYVSMKKGETWLITYSMFIPDTLDATSAFTHIHQIFGTTGIEAVAGPVVTMSLHQHEGVDSIEMRLDGTSGPHWNPTPLAPIQNRWVTVEFEAKWDNPGSFRWTIKDSEHMYVNASRDWNGWSGGERMRPKWGIYRSRGSAGLVNTYILLNNFRAYTK